ncbi:hypothetical protein FRX31_002896 [Thalictrum thalictroides]|uniref:Uncharacterized protein n=1 Tax=Thalictrum thalictroides TaxID=46969 RepID=A0A7J6XET3_THATH|nr:hypothetical protein FRX31_002896 [Thalictrum thalictroides]
MSSDPRTTFRNIDHPSFKHIPHHIGNGLLLGSGAGQFSEYPGSMGGDGRVTGLPNRSGFDGSCCACTTDSVV